MKKNNKKIDMNKISKDFFNKMPRETLMEIMPRMAIDLFLSEKRNAKLRMLNLILIALLAVDLIAFLIRTF